MPDHELVLLSDAPSTWGEDARQIQLECEGCDLIVAGKVGPAAVVDGFIAALREAHRLQVAEAEEAARR